MIAEKRRSGERKKRRSGGVRGSEWKSGKDFLGVRMCVAWRALATKPWKPKNYNFHRFDANSARRLHVKQPTICDRTAGQQAEAINRRKRRSKQTLAIECTQRTAASEEDGRERHQRERSTKSEKRQLVSAEMLECFYKI